MADQATLERPAEQLADDDNLTLRLSSPELTIESGGPAGEAVVTLANPNQTPPTDQYALEVQDLDPAWYTVAVRSVLLQRGDSAPLRIRFQVPRRAAEEGVYTYRVVA